MSRPLPPRVRPRRACGRPLHVVAAALLAPPRSRSGRARWRHCTLAVQAALQDPGHGRRLHRLTEVALALLRPQPPVPGPAPDPSGGRAPAPGPATPLSLGGPAPPLPGDAPRPHGRTRHRRPIGPTGGGGLGPQTTSTPRGSTQPPQPSGLPTPRPDPTAPVDQTPPVAPPPSPPMTGDDERGTRLAASAESAAPPPPRLPPLPPPVEPTHTVHRPSPVPPPPPATPGGGGLPALRFGGPTRAGRLPTPRGFTLRRVSGSAPPPLLALHVVPAPS